MKAPLPAKQPFRTHKAERSTQYFKGLFYGDYGAGKTQLGGSAQLVPEMYPMLVIDAEAGELTLVPGTDVVTVTNYTEIARVYDYLKAHCNLRDAARAGDTAALEQLRALNTAAGFDPDVMFNTVMIDSLTEAGQYLLYHLTGTVIGRNKLDDPPDFPERGEYRENYEMIQLLARSFRDLKMHVIIIASTEEVRLGGEDKKGNSNQRIVKRIMLSGKLSTRIQAFWGVVGYLEAKADQDGTKRRLWLEAGHDRFHAKNRLTSLPYVDDPTMQKLYTLLKESRDAHPAPANRTAERTGAPRPVRSGTGSQGARPGTSAGARAPGRAGAGAVRGRVGGRVGG